MLDSASVKFGALTDGRRWMWYYKEHNQVEPVRFLEVNALDESQSQSTVDWISLLKKRAKKEVSASDMLVAARSMSLTSRIKDWFTVSRENPTDSLARSSTERNLGRRAREKPVETSANLAGSKRCEISLVLQR